MSSLLFKIFYRNSAENIKLLLDFNGLNNLNNLGFTFKSSYYIRNQKPNLIGNILSI